MFPGDMFVVKPGTIIHELDGRMSRAIETALIGMIISTDNTSIFAITLLKHGLYSVNELCMYPA